MHVFIHEYTCGGALAACGGMESLRAEGWAMLAALVHDFVSWPGITVSTVLEPGRQFGPAVHCRHVGPEEEEAAFREAARTADLTLAIAPETGGILSQRHRWVAEAGGRWLGCTAEAIGLTGDKWALSRHLSAHAVPAPDCHPVQADRPQPPVSFPAVLKPRCGAGSQATMLLQTPAELREALEQARSAGHAHDMILQPFVAGQPASVSFLIGPRGCIPLAPAEQTLSTDGRFHYLGGVVPLPPLLAGRAVLIAGRAVATVSGLAGYVGADVVLGGAADGSHDRVIEMNPRLTTSYVGLRALAEDNLAGVLLRVWQGDDVPAIRWRPGRVQFQAGGPLTTPARRD